MLGDVNVYYLLYGDWNTLDPTTPAAIFDFTSHLGGSIAWGPVTTYYQTDANGNKAYISNSLSYKGYAIDSSYAYGKNISDYSIYAMVSNAITQGSLPPNNMHNIYLVLTAPDVTTQSGLCTVYCGWHSYQTFNGQYLIYGVIGSTIGCPACQSELGSPNNNLNADSMISTIYHELTETVTDPLFNAWVDDSGQENADKCAWNYGYVWTTSNGAMANVRLSNNKEYLLQTTWLNMYGGYCVNTWTP